MSDSRHTNGGGEVRPIVYLRPYEKVLIGVVGVLLTSLLTVAVGLLFDVRVALTAVQVEQQKTKVYIAEEYIRKSDLQYYINNEKRSMH